MSKFKVGDRVRVLSGCDTKSRFGWEASVIDGPDRAGCFDYEVRYDDGQQELFYEDNLMAAPYPTPTPAEKLRAAAEVVKAVTEEALAPFKVEQRNQLFLGLENLANHLEAAAAPKPTLREAVEAYRAAMEKGPQVGAEYAAMIEALAREEASKS